MLGLVESGNTIPGSLVMIGGMGKVCNVFLTCEYKLNVEWTVGRIQLENVVWGRNSNLCVCVWWPGAGDTNLSATHQR